MIYLVSNERKWIKTCKLHYKGKYPFKDSWVNTLKPLFKEIYAWDPEIDYQSYLNVLFNKLLEIYLKVADDKSGTNLELREIFAAAFYKSVSREDDLPIERAISQLCGLLQTNSVLEEDGTQRYEL